MVVLDLDQFVDEAAGIVEADLIPLPTGGERQTGGQGGLPSVGVPEHEDQLRLPKGVPTSQVEDRWVVDSGQAGEIKGGHVFQNGKPRGPNQLGLAMLLALGQLRLG
jgi:hypothetical protein